MTVRQPKYSNYGDLCRLVVSFSQAFCINNLLTLIRAESTEQDLKQLVSAVAVEEVVLCTQTGDLIARSRNILRYF